MTKMFLFFIIIMFAHLSVVSCQMTPLMRAAISGNVSEIHDLLSSRTRTYHVNSRNTDDGFTALTYAANGNHSEAVTKLLSEGADVNVRTYEYGYSALMIAAKDGYEEVVDALLTFTFPGPGLAIDLTDYNNDTALHLAAENNHVNVIRRLISAGANIEARGTLSYTPFLYAAVYQHRDAINVLAREFHANVNAQDFDGLTALMYAIESESFDTNLVQDLISLQGIDPMIFDRNGETASDKADEKGHSNIVAMLRVLIQRQRGEDLGYVTP